MLLFLVYRLRDSVRIVYVGYMFLLLLWVCYKYSCKVGLSSVRSSRRRVKYDYTRGAESVLNVIMSDIASRRIP